MKKTKPKILVVDDTPTVREAIQYYFEQQGYIIFTAASAEEALPIIKKDQPDILLLDITLPQMNGIELLKLVREFNKTVKVIVISAEIQKYKNDSLLKQRDIFAFLDKPPDFFELESLIKKALLQ